MYECRIACTVGEPVEGSDSDVPGSRLVRVRLMRRTAVELSVPERYILPIHPDGVKERVIIILGNNVGAEGVISNTGSIYWYLHVQPRANSVSHPAGDDQYYLVRREHMAVLGKRPMIDCESDITGRV